MNETVERSRPRLRSAVRGRTLLALIAGALLLRALFLIAEPEGNLIVGLPAVSGEAARNIVDRGEWFRLDPGASSAIGVAEAETGDLIDPEDFDYGPYGAAATPDLITPQGTTLLLAGLWEVTGSQRYIWLQVLQVLVGGLLTAVVVWLAWRLFERPRAAIIAGLLWALWPGILVYTTIPLYEIWAVYATVGVVALYVLARDRGRPWWMLALVGVAIALATLFRQGLILLPLAFVAYELRDSWRGAARTGAIVIGAMVIGLIPWTARNLIEFDQPRPVNGVSGQVLWEALGQDSDAFGAVYDDRITFEGVQRVRPDLEYGTPGYDDYLREEAFDAIADHPLDYAKVVAERVYRSTVANSFQGSVGTQREGVAGTAVRWADRVNIKLDTLLFLLALISAVALWRSPRHRGGIALLALVYVALLLTPALIAGHLWRYMAPALFVLFILTGAGIDEGWRRLEIRRTRSRPEAEVEAA